MSNGKSESIFLDEVFETYTVRESSQTRVLRELSFRIISPYLKQGQGLELGCSDGLFTEFLSKKINNFDVVDGSKKFLELAKARNLPNVNYIYSLFEEFQSNKKYDYIFANFILEHVNNPNDIYSIVKKYLKPSGLLFLIVPNANAFSRQMAVHMGILKSLKELTKNDINHGHRRVYDRVDLNREIERSGLISISQGGILFKILADFQLDQLFDNEMLKQEQIDALYKLGLEYPDFAGSIFSICKHSN